MLRTFCMCQPTCKSLANPVKCPQPGDVTCEKGCQCPVGQVQKKVNGEDQCISDSNCCIYNGVYYEVGKVGYLVQ